MSAGASAAGPALGGLAKDLFAGSMAGKAAQGFQTGGLAGAFGATPVGAAVNGAQQGGIEGLFKAMRATANQKPAADLKRREAEQGSIDALLAQLFPDV